MENNKSTEVNEIKPTRAILYLNSPGSERWQIAVTQELSSGGYSNRETE